VAQRRNRHPFNAIDVDLDAVARRFEAPVGANRRAVAGVDVTLAQPVALTR
jgi:hypothetical protein